MFTRCDRMPYAALPLGLGIKISHVLDQAEVAVQDDPFHVLQLVQESFLDTSLTLRISR